MNRTRYNRKFPLNWSPAKDGLYWREWAAVLRKDKSADRHALHVKALGFDKSHLEFNNDDFDKVLGAFRAISRPGDLQSQLNALTGRKVRLIFGIRRTATKLKVGDPYILATAKTQTGRALTSIEQLDEDELENLRIALAQQVRRQTKAAKELSEHIATCDQCAGPDDGCEEGQRLEEPAAVDQPF